MRLEACFYHCAGILWSVTCIRTDGFQELEWFAEYGHRRRLAKVDLNVLTNLCLTQHKSPRLAALVPRVLVSHAETSQRRISLGGTFTYVHNTTALSTSEPSQQCSGASSAPRSCLTLVTGRR